jgi:hypothetical protein
MLTFTCGKVDMSDWIHIFMLSFGVVAILSPGNEGTGGKSMYLVLGCFETYNQRS